MSSYIVKDIYNFLYKKTSRPYFDPATLQYYKTPPWNEAGERVVDTLENAKWAAKKAKAMGFDTVINNLGNGQYKVVRTKAPEYNENDPDIDMNDLYELPSYSHPSRGVAYSTGRTARKYINPDQRGGPEDMGWNVKNPSGSRRGIGMPMRLTSPVRMSKSLAERINSFVTKAYNKYAVATASAEKLGYHDFSEGSAGRKKRDEIAEAMEREAHAKGKSVDSKGNIS